MSSFAGPQGVRGESEGRGARASPGRWRGAWRPAGCSGGQPRAIQPRGRPHRRGVRRLRTGTRPPLACPPCAHAVRAPPRARPSLPAVTSGRGRACVTANLTSSLRHRHVCSAPYPLNFNGNNLLLTSPPRGRVGSSTSGNRRKRRAHGHVVRRAGSGGGGRVPESVRVSRAPSLGFGGRERVRSSA